MDGLQLMANALLLLVAVVVIASGTVATVALVYMVHILKDIRHIVARARNGAEAFARLSLFKNIFSKRYAKTKTNKKNSAE